MKEGKAGREGRKMTGGKKVSRKKEGNQDVKMLA